MSDLVLVTRDESIAVVQLNRPEVLNRFKLRERRT